MPNVLILDLALFKALFTATAISLSQIRTCQRII